MEDNSGFNIFEVIYKNDNPKVWVSLVGLAFTVMLVPVVFTKSGKSIEDKVGNHTNIISNLNYNMPATNYPAY